MLASLDPIPGPREASRRHEVILINSERDDIGPSKCAVGGARRRQYIVGRKGRYLRAAGALAHARRIRSHDGIKLFPRTTTRDHPEVPNRRPVKPSLSSVATCNLNLRVIEVVVQFMQSGSNFESLIALK